MKATSVIKRAYDKLPKDEDGYVLFGDDNHIFLKKEMFGKHSISEIIAFRVYDDGTIGLWELYADDETSADIYDDCEHEVLERLIVAINNPDTFRDALENNNADV